MNWFHQYDSDPAAQSIQFNWISMQKLMLWTVVKPPLTLSLYSCVVVKTDTIQMTQQFSLTRWKAFCQPASQECVLQRCAAQMVVLAAGERTSNKAGQCQLGPRCLKHQFLEAGYKVISDGFITDSLCQSVFMRTWSRLMHSIIQHFLQHIQSEWWGSAHTHFS